MKRMMIILITFAVLVLSAKVIYQFEPEKPHLLKPKTMKSKSAEFFQAHKENYMRYLDEETDLNYITAQKVDTKGDSVKKYSSILYNDRINIKKLNELRKLGLVNYTTEQLQWIESARYNRISLNTLAYRILASNFIFLGTAINSISPSGLKGEYITKVNVRVDNLIKGEYYFEEVPKIFNVYCRYGQEAGTDIIYTAEECGETELVVGKKYIFFAYKQLAVEDNYKYLNDMDLLINNQLLAFSIENNKIKDKRWDFRDSEQYRDVTKLKEYIKLLEETNETEKFFEIDFK